MNRSLYGIVLEASEHGGFGEIYGARHGLDGVLSNDLVDLTANSKAAWCRIAGTPGAVLGSTRRRLQDEDVPAVLDALSSNRIGYLFVIGGNDSAETGHRLNVATERSGYDLAVIAVPKTIDNDLVETDHTPGYGSAARFVALATMGAGRDAEAMGRESPIALIEVMGRDAGWLAASAALAKREDRDAPHVICLPEVPVDEDRFLELMEAAYRRYGFAVALISENARGVDGVLGGQQKPWYVDDFGHPYYDGPARYLAGLVGSHLGVRARYEKPGTIQRSMMACVSATDAREAEMVGRAAVRSAADGQCDQMVTLVREPIEDLTAKNPRKERYACTTGLAPLEQVAGQVKRMPNRYLDTLSYFVTPEFAEYARPLIGASLPRFGRV